MESYEIRDGSGRRTIVRISGTRDLALDLISTCQAADMLDIGVYHSAFVLNFDPRTRAIIGISEAASGRRLLDVQQRF